MRILVLIISTTILSCTISAQNSRVIDSLNAEIQHADHDSIEVRLLLELSEYIYLTNPDTTILICQHALKISSNLNLASSKAECFGWLGYLVNQQGYVEEALDYQLQSLKIREEILSHNGRKGNPPLSLAEQTKLETDVANTLSNIASIYEEKGQIKRAVELYDRALTINTEHNNTLGIATVLNNLGSLYLEQGHISKGLEFYRKSLNQYELIKNDRGIATSLNNIAELYERQGDLATGLTFLHRSLNILEKLDDKQNMGTLFNNLAHIYESQGDSKTAFDYYQRSMKLYKETNNIKGKARVLNSLGSLYRSQGETIKGLEHYFLSLKLYKEIGYSKEIPSVLNNIGKVYEEDGQLDKALLNYKESIQIHEQFRNKKGISSTLIHVASVFLKRGEVQKAKFYGNKGLELAKSLGYPEKISNSAQFLAELHKKEGEFEKSLSMYELFIQMRDSINNEKTQKATIRQQTKYEFEKAQLIKEQEEKEAARILLERTSRRDNLQYSVILIAILVLFGGVLALGFIDVSIKMAEGIIFFSFLILFEFLLVLADPYIDNWSGGAPGIKLLFNAGIAALIFPMHAFFEDNLKGRLVKSQRSLF